MKIEEAISLFHTYIATERRLAAGTVRNYIGDLEDLRLFLSDQGVVDLDELRARDVREWQVSHMEKGESAGTMRRRLSSLSAFFRYLRLNGLYDADIMAKIASPKKPKHLPVFYKERELEHLYDDGIFGTDFIGRRDALILRMLYETGMRRSELTGLRESSVDTGSLTIKVLGKRNKERFIPIENELAHNISEYITLKQQTVGDSEWLFVNKHGKPLQPGNIYQIVRKYMTGLSTADRISPHVFRHSFATHMLNEGAGIKAIQELLGHADLSSTEVYTHVTREHLKQVYRNAFPRGKKKNT